MRICIPLFGDRVAPRCTQADGVLLCTLRRGRVIEQERLTLPIRTLIELKDVLRGRDVHTLVCGGINRNDRDVVEPLLDRVVPNVAGTIEEVLREFVAARPEPSSEGNRRIDRGRSRLQPSPLAAGNADAADCLSCAEPSCLAGQGCSLRDRGILRGDHDQPLMLDVARDLNGEDERRLCRLSELVYFGLEMGYRRIGIAYCMDLKEPALTLAGVLRRFFTVHAVCCKLQVPEAGERGGVDPGDATLPCNPVAQAAALERAGTDLNVIVGLCMGADCVFNQASRAPVTTLFAKDRALANNPIGAVYSDRYLREAEQSLPRDSSHHIASDRAEPARHSTLDHSLRERQHS